ncbi:hypothetical protein BZG36_02748 [Bifiguratus adelaidae]|uniref:Ribosomal protein L10 n=1 Tax=Bifiguratus adelaidae TaxID=1938954 RepID=A0A261XYP5_9FUNG|nr:hypothetical protein BZG36_02748 [Bifiguratus adelaidae]
MALRRCAQGAWSPIAHVRSYATVSSQSVVTTRRQYLFDKYRTLLQSNRFLLILQHNNLTVAELAKLRHDLAQYSNTELLVVRNGLFSASLKQSPFENLSPLVLGPTSVLASNISDADHPTAIKDLINALSKQKKLVLLGGRLDNRLLNYQDLDRLTQIPGQQQLYAELLGLLQAPASRLTGVLQQSTQTLVAVLDQHAKNLAPKAE